MSICNIKTESTGITGLYTNIQRMCSHDGPGLRSTIFLKGCPLCCTWCHNPETMHSVCEIAWDETKCIGCGSCVTVCTANALQMHPDRLRINKEKCTLCQSCADECPTGAIIWYGQRISVQEAFKELAKDKQYYAESGGGITISGGEPLVQPEFTGRLLEQARTENIPTALDTTFYAPWEVIEKLLPNLDIALIDMKLFDSERHKAMTGVDNMIILDNIKKTAQFARENKTLRIFIRTPLIPGCTADEENVQKIGGFIKENLEDVLEKWELLLFHDMCSAKYKSLERPWQHEDTPMINKKQVKELQTAVDNCGISKEKTSILGLAVD